MHQRAAYQRLRTLHGLGLVAYQRWWYRQPGVYLATREGLSVGEVDLPLPRVDVRSYWHTLAAVDLAIELDGPAGVVVSERELRAADQGVGHPGELCYCPVLRHGLDGLQLHVPDLVVTGEAALPHAYEVELTAKRIRRLRQIVRAYVRARHLSGVTYVTPSQQIAGVVQRVAGEFNAGEVVTVTRWQPTEGCHEPW
jgi:hypothetical protein